MSAPTPTPPETEKVRVKVEPLGGWTCAAPKRPVAEFDIDVYDCPCGHGYGEHEYSYDAPTGGRMVIHGCGKCGQEPPAWKEGKG